MNKYLQSCAITIASIASISGTAAIAAGESGEYVNEIAPNVYSYSPGNGYHSMFVVTEEGVAVFETVNSQHSTSMLEVIQDITDQPVVYGFQTHNHWDHASGGAVLQSDGAETVMHRQAAEWLEANPGRDTSPPDIVWSGGRHDIELGGVTIEHHYLGLNHGLGMTVFVVPELEVAYIGDLVTPNRVMFNIVPDFNIGEWERSLGEILELNFETAVCSHSELPAGEVENGCTKEHVAEERAYIQDLRGAIFAEFEKGTPASEIPTSIELPQYAHWAHYDDWLAMNAQRVLLDLWMGPYPWVPEEPAE